MICESCNQELTEKSKFCDNCGNKVKAKAKAKEMNMIEMCEEMIKDASVMWFTIGLIKGNCSKDEKKKKWFKDVFEKGMLKNPELKKKYEYVNSKYNKWASEK
jgi:hypothetical protein